MGVFQKFCARLCVSTLSFRAVGTRLAPKSSDLVVNMVNMVNTVIPAVILVMHSCVMSAEVACTDT